MLIGDGEEMDGPLPHWGTGTADASSRPGRIPNRTGGRTGPMHAGGEAVRSRGVNLTPTTKGSSCSRQLNSV